MAETGIGLFRRRGKCAGNPRRISYIRPELVFPGAQQKSAQNANEISALRSELVFRQIPGELVQRRWHSQRFGGRIRRNCTLLDPVRGCVLRVSRAPVCLCLLTPGCLALRFAAGALSISDSWVRPKPLPADPARSLPGLCHGDPSSSPRGPCQGCCDFRSQRVGQFWQAQTGQFSRAPKQLQRKRFTTSSLAGSFGLIRSNLCTRHILNKLTPRRHHDWPDKATIRPGG